MRLWPQCGIFVSTIVLVCVNPDLLPLASARSPLVKSAPDKAKSTSDLQGRFDHESNSVHKAKLFEKLSDEQLAEVRRLAQASDYNTIGTIMEKYRDNARAAVAALKKEHPNAEHQINGYKQLQIHIRRAIRDLKETVLLAPDEYKPPLQLVERDLALIDDELLQSLFPSPPQTASPPDNPPMSNNATPPANSQAQSTPASAPSGSALEQTPGGAAQAAPAGSAESNTSTTPNSDSTSQQTAPSSVEGSQERSDMNIQNCILTAVVTCGIALSTCGELKAQFEQKDYLSPMESDKIRDAETTNDRLKL